MGSPTSAAAHLELELALDVGAYRPACRLAALLGELDLIDSLRLALLAAREDRAHFDRLARDWIARAISEGALGACDLTWVVPLLHGTGAGRRRDGDRLLLLLRHRHPQ